MKACSFGGIRSDLIGTELRPPPRDHNHMYPVIGNGLQQKAKGFNRCPSCAKRVEPNRALYLQLVRWIVVPCRMCNPVGLEGNKRESEQRMREETDWQPTEEEVAWARGNVLNS